MGTTEVVLFLEIIGDFSLSEVGISIFADDGRPEEEAHLMGIYYKAEWVSDFEGPLSNPKVRNSYRLKTLQKKDG